MNNDWEHDPHYRQHLKAAELKYNFFLVCKKRIKTANKF